MRVRFVQAGRCGCGACRGSGAGAIAALGAGLLQQALAASSVFFQGATSFAMSIPWSVARSHAVPAKGERCPGEQGSENPLTTVSRDCECRRLFYGHTSHYEYHGLRFSCGLPEETNTDFVDCIGLPWCHRSRLSRRQSAADWGRFDGFKFAPQSATPRWRRARMTRAAT